MRPDDETEDLDLVAVVPIEPRSIYVVDRGWYGRLDSIREPLELVAIAVTRSGRCYQLIIDNGTPQLLIGENEEAYEDAHDDVRAPRRSA